MESFWDFADQMAELVSVMYRCGVSGGVRTSRSQRNSVANWERDVNLIGFPGC